MAVGPIYYLFHGLYTRICIRNSTTYSSKIGETVQSLAAFYFVCVSILWKRVKEKINIKQDRTYFKYKFEIPMSDYIRMPINFKNTKNLDFWLDASYISNLTADRKKIQRYVISRCLNYLPWHSILTVGNSLASFQDKLLQSSDWDIFVPLNLRLPSRTCR